MKRVRIVGVGSAFPGELIDNQRLLDETNLGADVTPEWIEQKIGIKTRYSSVELPIDHDNMRPSEGNCNSDLCAKAARKALAQAGLDVTDLELILVATCTPDYPVPSTASIVQEKLGIDECAAIDIRSACCGSTQAIVTALQYLQTGYYSCAVVIGSETGSVFGNLTNKRNSFSRGDTVNAAMIGDGAAACVLRAFPSVAFSRKQRQEQKAEDEAGERGIEIVYSKLNCIGKGKKPGMYIPGGGSLCPLNEKRVEEGLHYFKHDYRGVLAHGAELYLRALKDGLQGGGVAMGDVDLFIPHQANGKITEIARKVLNGTISYIFFAVVFFLAVLSICVSCYFSLALTLSSNLFSQTDGTTNRQNIFQFRESWKHSQRFIAIMSRRSGTRGHSTGGRNHHDASSRVHQMALWHPSSALLFVEAPR
ncbi:Beta-ketoacyl-[acyl-carrier-protein] synthase III, variant 3 [Balamuthia mandrillaris]